MECQREEDARLRLTDQAALAVRLAGARAEAGGRSPTVVDLMVGLAAEPHGVAGALLRRREHAVVALDQMAVPPRLAPLDLAVAWAVTDAGGGAAGTPGLLTAALEAGGADLADVLETAGVDAAALVAGTPTHELVETVGLRPPGEGDPLLSAEAALAVARARAAGGGSVDLLLAVAAGPRGEAPPALPDADDLAARRAQLLPADPPPAWDRGVDAVVDAARTWGAGGMVTSADLVRAALVVGGDGPGAVLEGAGGARSPDA